MGGMDALLERRRVHTGHGESTVFEQPLDRVRPLGAWHTAGCVRIVQTDEGIPTQQARASVSSACVRFVVRGSLRVGSSLQGSRILLAFFVLLPEHDPT